MQYWVNLVLHTGLVLVHIALLVLYLGHALDHVAIEPGTPTNDVNFAIVQGSQVVSTVCLFLYAMNIFDTDLRCRC